MLASKKNSSLKSNEKTIKLLTITINRKFKFSVSWIFKDQDSYKITTRIDSCPMLTPSEGIDLYTVYTVGIQYTVYSEGHILYREAPTSSSK